MSFLRSWCLDTDTIGGEHLLRFYKIASLVALGLFSVTGFTLYIGGSQAQIDDSLLPAQSSELPWEGKPWPPEARGRTSLTVNIEDDIIGYSFYLSAEHAHPTTSYLFSFAEASEPDKVVDLSKYSEAAFNIRCDPKNILAFTALTFDEGVTNELNPLSRRVSSVYVLCSEDWKRVTVQLDQLSTRQWWLEAFNRALTDTNIRLDKVFAVGFVNSDQSPKATLSQVEISDLRFLGVRKSYTYTAYALASLFWIVFFNWLFRSYLTALVRDAKEKVRRDQPLVAYEDLSIAPHENTPETAVVRFMATEYSNADLSLSTVSDSVGVDPSRVNGILKDEIGLTFNACLNKIRLTEAARLLSENSEVGVAEIAYSVGYKNVTYFNKLFKERYGCSPKAFINSGDSSGL